MKVSFPGKIQFWSYRLVNTKFVNFRTIFSKLIKKRAKRNLIRFSDSLHAISDR